MKLRRALVAIVAGFISASAVGSGPARAEGPAQAAKTGKTIQIVISNIAFGPATVNATVGDTIEWFNKDVVDHTATARNKAWNVTIPVGKKASVVVKTAGSVQYFCEFHPNMTGQVVVKK